MGFDVQAALNDGYSVQEISDHLKFNYKAAIGDGYSDDEIAQHLSSISTEPVKPAKTKKKVTGSDILDSAGIGLKNFGYTAEQTFHGLIGGLGRTIGPDRNSPEPIGSDESFAKLQQSLQEQKAYNEQFDQTTGSQVISGVAQVLPAFAAAPLGAAGVVGMGAAIPTLSSAFENVEKGASTEQAMKQAGVDAITNTAAMAMPVGRGLVRGATLGLGGNVISQGVQDDFGRKIFDPEQKELQQKYAMTPEKYIVAAATGAVPGAILGRMNRNGALEAQPKPEEEKSDGTRAAPPSAKETDATLLANRLAEHKESSDKLIDFTNKVESIKQSIEDLRMKSESDRFTSAQAEALQKLEQFILPKAEADLVSVKDGLAKLEKDIALLRRSSQTPKGIAPDEQTPVFDRTGKPVETVATKPLDPETQKHVDALTEQIDSIQRYLGTPHAKDQPEAVIKDLQNQLETNLQERDRITGSDQPVPRATEEVPPVQETTLKSESLDDATRNYLITHYREMGDLEIQSRFPEKVKEYNRATGPEKELLGIELGVLVEEANSRGVRTGKLPSGIMQKTEGNATSKVNVIEVADLAKGKYDFTKVDSEIFDDAMAIATKAEQEGTGDSPATNKAIIDSILSKIFEKYGDHHIGILAKAILDNQTTERAKLRIVIEENPDGTTYIRPLLDYVDAAGNKHNDAAGMYQPVTHGVDLGKAGMNADTFVHEFLHSMTSHVINAVRSGDYARLGLTASQVAAANRIVSLYERFGNAAKRFDARITDIDEFLVYGVTNDNFMHWLSKQQTHTGNLLTDLWNAIAKTLGFDAEQGNALKDLMNATEILVKKDTGKYKEVADRLIQSEVAKPSRSSDAAAMARHAKNLANAIANAPDMPNHWFARNWFGWLQYGEQAKQYPLVGHALAVAREAINVTTMMKANWTRGSDAVKYMGKHPVTTLKAILSGDAPLELARKASDKDVRVVHAALQEGANIRRPYADTLALYKGKVSESQYKLMESLTKMFEKMYEDTRQHSIVTGMPYPKKREGWIPAVRMGDFGVMVHDRNGFPVHFERFRSQAQAENWLRQHRKSGRTDLTPTTIMDLSKKPEGYYQDMMDMMLDLSDNFGMRDKVATQMSMMSSLGAKLGKHHEYRSGVTGDLANRWYRTDKESASDIRKSWVAGVDEFANAHKRRIVNYYTNDLMNLHGLDQKVKNQYASAKAILDSVKGEHSDSTKFFSTFVRDSFDGMFKSVHDLVSKDKGYYPDLPVWDRLHAVLGSMFYIRTLTSRPGFWVSQLLSSPQALRQVMKEASPMDASIAAGKGWMKALSGGDEQFKKDVLWVANNRETFHPQFVNELNTINILGRGGSEKLKEIFGWASGQTPGAIADSFSRYMTFAMMREHYIKQGFKGRELLEKAADATDKTMVMYANQYKAPVIQKTGIIGQAVAPLQTFATAQLGLMAADYKHMIKNKTLASTAPLLVTTLTTAIMGGAIGAPLIAEWELLRLALKKVNINLPSIMEMLLTNDKLPPAVVYGIPSELGFDFGSGLRWNQLVSKSLAGDSSMMDMFPVVKSAVDLATDTWNIGKHMAGGDVEEGVARKSYLNQSSYVIGGKALADAVHFNSGDRKMIPQGPGSQAFKEQTTKDQWGQLIGSMPMEARTQERANFMTMKQKREREEVRKKFVTIAADSINTGDNEKLMGAISRLKETGLDGRQISRLIENNTKNRYIPQHIRNMLQKDKQGVLDTLEYQAPVIQ